jgi:SEC-C motif
MLRIGRNDPCPCGSGKKYKKCCLVSVEDADFQYRRWRQVEARLIPRLTAFTFEALGSEIVAEAWRHFNDDEFVEEFDPQSSMTMVFMPWLLFSWIFELKPPGSAEFTRTTIAERFVLKNPTSLSSDEEMLLRSAIRCPFTLCEVVDVKPGVGMTQFDLFRRIKYEVVERSASQTLKRGEIIYCATTDLGGIRSNIGTSPYALRPTAKRDVMKLRRWMVDEIGKDEISAEHLHEFEQDIRGLYLDILEGMFAPPSLANTDGDPIVPQKLYFDIESADGAFHCLKDLAEGVSESDLLTDASIVDKVIVKAEIPWQGGSETAKKRLGGAVLLGSLKIEKDRLIVEVNSKERAAAIRQLIDERLGNNARYVTTLIEPIESRVEEMWEAAMAGSDRPATDGMRLNKEDADSISGNDEELREVMKAMAQKQWQAWFDLPVPALDDMTPREAAKTEEGRELLESLLLYYEINRTKSIDDSLGPDIPAMRTELGMD